MSIETSAKHAYRWISSTVRSRGSGLSIPYDVEAVNAMANSWEHISQVSPFNMQSSYPGQHNEEIIKSRFSYSACVLCVETYSDSDCRNYHESGAPWGIPLSTIGVLDSFWVWPFCYSRQWNEVCCNIDLMIARGELLQDSHHILDWLGVAEKEKTCVCPGHTRED